MQAKKSLGQHWLKDQAALEAICQAAELRPTDTVLEVGPGQGDLTRHILKDAQKVISVEIDKDLSGELSEKISDPKLRVVNQDILKFDLTQLPASYKVVANIPYYLTSNLIRILSESPNPPQTMVILVQKEVAERVAARPGQMSLLSVSAQLYYQPSLGQVVPAALFEPPPKVDSQILILRRHQTPLIRDLDTKLFFRLVKAGFAGRRKKLRGSLSAGLSIDKHQADKLLKTAGIDGSLRAQNLGLSDWHKLYLACQKSGV